MKKSLLCLALSGLVTITSFAAEPAQTQNNDGTTMQTTSTANPGAAFLETNKNKKGVTTLPDGLQYEIVTEGKGKKPGPTDTVTVDYEGKLVNGKVFDSSYQRGEAASFRVDQVIPGWQEALQLMNEGATWMLYIPANLAYGQEGAGGVIGPNETLIFKVHLIKVK